MQSVYIFQYSIISIAGNPRERSRPKSLSMRELSRVRGNFSHGVLLTPGFTGARYREHYHRRSP